MKHAIEVWRDNVFGEGRSEGWSEGRSKGRKEALMQTARKLKARGMNTNDIVDATDLTLDDVLQL